MIDNKTSRLQLPLPNVENYLEEDVERLSEALTTLDGVVATIAEDGKLVQDQVPEYVARLDTEGRLPSDNLPVSAVQTDGAGKIPESVIPEAIARDSEVLSRNGNLSELADRAAAWLNVRPVGATPLAGDPVGDYDAATKRWVQNLLNTGTTGPTMNGVMNYGVGDFHLRDSRAYIQPYEVLSDGQLLNRADWPELWAYAQMLSPISDAEWLADKFKRGRYSTGNGTTTFRVPDRNGVQNGSVAALYGRGDGNGRGGASSGADGQVFESAAPNITGAVASFSGSSYAQVFGVANGAYFTNNGFYPDALGDAIPSTGPISVSGRLNTLNFDASRSSPIYGGSNDEIMGRNFVGVWVIRASGGFTAAKTSWSVINADATKPANGTRANSGTVSVEYKVGTAIEAQGKVYTAATMGGKYSTQLSVKNATSGKEKDISVTEDGDLWSDRFKARFGTLMSWSETGSIQGTYSVAKQQVGQNYAFNSVLSAGQEVDTGYLTTLHHGLIHNNNSSFAQATWLAAGDSNSQYITRMNIQPNSHDVFFSVSILGSDSFYTLQKSAISDATVKHDIAPSSVDKAWSNLAALQYVTFVYNNDEQARTRRGIIAQQAETVDPLYVKTITYYPDEGSSVEQKQLDTTPMLLDTMHVVQTLMLKIEAMEAEIAELKASK